MTLRTFSSLSLLPVAQPLCYVTLSIQRLSLRWLDPVAASSPWASRLSVQKGSQRKEGPIMFLLFSKVYTSGRVSRYQTMAKWLEKHFSLVHRVWSFATFSNPLQYYRQSCKNFKHFLQRCQYDWLWGKWKFHQWAHYLKKIKFNSIELFQYRSVLSNALNRARN